MNHLTFQILLVAALIVFFFYIYRLRTPLTDRILYLVFGLVGLVLILHPDLSTSIANQVSIGRGADLIFYLSIIAGLFYAVTMTARLRQMQRQLTLVTRQMALSQPYELEQNPPDTTQDELPGL